MDKAELRSRMREAAQRREKRIDSPLVRYNELGQAVCKVCNVVVKSQALWSAHVASRQHKEAAEELKSRAKAGKPASLTQQTKEPTVAPSTSVNRVASDETAPAANLPKDFFDGPAAPEARAPEPPSQAKKGEAAPVQEVKGAVPQGFFDNPEADMRARGIEVPKRDLKEEMQEFQRSIEDDLKALQEKEQEEELEALEYREGEEEFEQRLYMERVETFKRRKLSLARREARATTPGAAEDLLLGLSSEDEDDESVDDDWRVKK